MRGCHTTISGTPTFSMPASSARGCYTATANGWLTRTATFLPPALSYAKFGNPLGTDGERVRAAVALLDRRGVSFEYDGEMSADVALNERLMHQLYPFCRLRGPANILVMPELHSANIAAKLLPELG